MKNFVKVSRKDRKIEVVYFPPYSPEEGPQEHCLESRKKRYCA